jgi:hypothetical protein
MDARCPTCNRKWTKTAWELDEALAVVHWSPQQQTVVDAVARGGVTVSTLVGELYADGRPDNADTVAKIHVGTIRKKLKPFGWGIPKHKESYSFARRA